MAWVLFDALTLPTIMDLDDLMTIWFSKTIIFFTNLSLLNHDIFNPLSIACILFILLMYIHPGNSTWNLEIPGKGSSSQLPNLHFQVLCWTPHVSPQAPE